MLNITQYMNLVAFIYQNNNFQQYQKLLYLKKYTLKTLISTNIH
jgi:hypothetical protein